jgi:hypothetical protein
MDTCSICLDTIDNNSEFLPCAHKFHISCLTELFEHDLVICPVCRIPININTPEDLVIYNDELKNQEESISGQGETLEERELRHIQNRLNNLKPIKRFEEYINNSRLIKFKNVLDSYIYNMKKCKMIGAEFLYNNTNTANSYNEQIDDINDYGATIYKLIKYYNKICIKTCFNYCDSYLREMEHMNMFDIYFDIYTDKTEIEIDQEFYNISEEFDALHILELNKIESHINELIENLNQTVYNLRLV